MRRRLLASLAGFRCELVTPPPDGCVRAGITRRSAPPSGTWIAKGVLRPSGAQLDRSRRVLAAVRDAGTP